MKTPKFVVSVATLLLCAGQSLGQSALDFLPDSLSLAFVAPNPADFVERIEGLMGEDLAAGMMGPLSDAKQLLALDGIRGDGMFAFGVQFKEDSEEEPNEFGFIPVSDFAALMASLDGTNDSGVFVADIDGVEKYFKDIGGGYALMTGDAEAASAYKKPSGGFYKSSLADSKKIADNSEAMFIINVASAGSMLDAMGEGFAEGLAMNPAMPMEGAGEAMSAMFDQFEENTRGVVLGFDVEDQGLTLMGSVQFKEGSKWAGSFSGTGKSSSLLSKLPATPYIIAMAVDYTVPAIREFQQMMNEAGQQGENPMEQMGLNLEGVDGMGMVLGMSPGIMSGQIFANTMTYMAGKDPKALVAKMKDIVGNANGLETEGMAFATEYTEAATDINGTPADLWTFKFDIDPNHPAAAQLEQAMIMFPGKKMTGYTAAAKGGVVTTLSKNKGLLEQSLGAVAGEAPTLASDDILAATAKKLPDNRFFEMYLGVGEVFNMVGAMMGFEAPEGLPPIALGMGSAKNAMTFGLSIDKRVFTTIMEMQGGMGEGMGDEMGDEDDGSF